MTTHFTLSPDHRLVLVAIDRRKLSYGRGVFRSNIAEHLRLAEPGRRNLENAVTGALVDLVTWNHIDRYETAAGRWMYRLTLLGLEAVCNPQADIAV